VKRLLIQYTVLYSKAGYAPAAAVLCRWLQGDCTPPQALDAVQEELAYAGAPAWLYNSLVWHLAEMHEKVQTGQR